MVSLLSRRGLFCLVAALPFVSSAKTAAAPTKPLVFGVDPGAAGGDMSIWASSDGRYLTRGNPLIAEMPFAELPDGKAWRYERATPLPKIEWRRVDTFIDADEDEFRLVKDGRVVARF